MSRARAAYARLYRRLPVPHSVASRPRLPAEPLSRRFGLDRGRLQTLAEAGAFVFGSGLAIVPFLHGGVVRGLRWLDDRQFLDAVCRNGIQLRAKARVTVRTKLERLVGGATEETIIARVNGGKS